MVALEQAWNNNSGSLRSIRNGMLSATCHCGVVKVEVPRRPRQLTNCNCSICRRYGALWAYYRAAEVSVICKAGATEVYEWGQKTLRFVRCCGCGCVTHGESVNPRPGDKIGVNARMFAPSQLGSVRIRLFDGADSWKYLS
jgi:hypothetical protein